MKWLLVHIPFLYRTSVCIIGREVKWNFSYAFIYWEFDCAQFPVKPRLLFSHMTSGGERIKQDKTNFTQKDLVLQGHGWKKVISLCTLSNYFQQVV